MNDNEKKAWLSSLEDDKWGLDDGYTNRRNFIKLVELMFQYFDPKVRSGEHTGLFVLNDRLIRHSKLKSGPGIDNNYEDESSYASGSGIDFRGNRFEDIMQDYKQWKKGLAPNDPGFDETNSKAGISAKNTIKYLIEKLDELNVVEIDKLRLENLNLDAKYASEESEATNEVLFKLIQLVNGKDVVEGNTVRLAGGYKTHTSYPTKRMMQLLITGAFQACVRRDNEHGTYSSSTNKKPINYNLLKLDLIANAVVIREIADKVNQRMKSFIDSDHGFIVGKIKKSILDNNSNTISSNALASLENNTHGVEIRQVIESIIISDVLKDYMHADLEAARMSKHKDYKYKTRYEDNQHDRSAVKGIEYQTEFDINKGTGSGSDGYEDADHPNKSATKDKDIIDEYNQSVASRASSEIDKVVKALAAYNIMTKANKADIFGRDFVKDQDQSQGPVKSQAPGITDEERMINNLLDYDAKNEIDRKLSNLQDEVFNNAVAKFIRLNQGEDQISHDDTAVHMSGSHQSRVDRINPVYTALANFRKNNHLRGNYQITKKSLVDFISDRSAGI